MPDPWVTLETAEGIVRACNVRLGRPLGSDALDDVVQEILLVSLEKRHEVEGVVEPDVWIYGVARFSILRRMQARGRSRLRNAPQSELDQQAAPDDAPGACAPETGQSTVRRNVRRCMDAAGTTIASILQRRFDKGEGFKTIGEALGMSRTAVRSRYYRFVPLLRQRLRPLWSSRRGQSPK